MSGQANLKILIFPNNCLKSDTFLSLRPPVDPYPEGMGMVDDDLTWPDLTEGMVWYGMVDQT